MSAIGWHIARVTIEAQSPLSCASGQRGEADVLLVRDAGGLPMIPGPTLQGLSRSLCAASERDSWFGEWNDADGSSSPARLIFSHALVHGAADVSVEFSPYRDAQGDSLLERLGAPLPLVRDHVRLDTRHSALDGGKFDRAAVPKGARFSFEIMLAGEESEARPVEEVVATLRHPLFRVGGATRRGYGKITVIEAKRAFVTDPETIGRIRARPLSDKAELDTAIMPARSDGVTEVKLRLQTINPWRVGADGLAVLTGASTGRQRKGEARAREKPVDAAPSREGRIDWTNGYRWIAPEENNLEGYVLPGSAIRGPLAHRSLFHWNRLQGDQGHINAADLSNEDARAACLARLQELGERRDALCSLFGIAKEDRDGGGERGQASRLVVDDTAVSVSEVIALDHNSIDRFSGGVRSHMLFSEELIAPGKLDITILIDDRDIEDRPPLDHSARLAFCCALRDLSGGRLALGAKSHGFCRGEVDWGSAPPAAWDKAWKEASA
jgi:CRISPR/Cas system CSM-associated protein Csm3 (group 7 of RAMP superfamily)